MRQFSLLGHALFKRSVTRGARPTTLTNASLLLGAVLSPIAILSVMILTNELDQRVEH